MPDIGYYTLPVIPSFRGIESATQDQLDKAFRDSGKKAGETYADEHEKAFKKKTADSARARTTDADVDKATKQDGAAAGKKAGDAYNDAFNKTRQEQPPAADQGTVEAARKSGQKAGQAAGKAQADATTDELKKTADSPEMDSVGRAIGKNVGAVAGAAAANALEDFLPSAISGIDLSGLGESLGESVGGALGEHVGEIPGKLVEGFKAAHDALTGGSAGSITGAIDGIKTAADAARDALSGIGDGLHNAVAGVRNLKISDITDSLHRAVEGVRNLSTGDIAAALGQTTTFVQKIDTAASQVGIDISGWTTPLEGALGSTKTFVDQVGGMQSSFKEFAGTVTALAPGMGAALDTALGPIGVAAAAILAAKAAMTDINNFWNSQTAQFNKDMGDPNSPAYKARLAPAMPPAQAAAAPVKPGQPLAPTDMASMNAMAQLAAGGDKEALAQLHARAGAGDKTASDLLKSIGKQAGGPIDGPGPRGEDSVLMWGAPGEHVLTADEVDKAGGHRGVYALRSVIRGLNGGGPVGGDDWDAIAEKESGGNWADNTGNGYYGGLQFDLSTWHDFGGEQFAPRPDMTSRENQITVANRVPPEQRAHRWPHTYSAGAGRGGSGMMGVGGDFGAAAGHPTAPPPDERAIRGWVEQNFGIPNTFGTGSWENAAHDADAGWHHNLTRDKSQPGYAFDFHGTPQQMDALANWVADNYKDKTLELIHQGAGFDHNREIKNAKFGDVYGPGLNAAHADHVHWAMTVPPWMGGLPGGGGAGAAGIDGGGALPRGRRGDPLYVLPAPDGSGTGGAASGTGGRGSPFQQAGGAAGLGAIGKQFLNDTFGFGTILPGLDEFPPMQFLSGLLGGLFGGGGGGSGGGGGGLFGMLGSMLSPGGGGAGGGSGSPFGMIPGLNGDTTATTPGGDPAAPAGFDPALPGLSAGLGNAPAAGDTHIDQSMNVTVNGRSDDDMLGRLGRVIQHPPRVLTHAPPGT